MTAVERSFVVLSIAVGVLSAISIAFAAAAVLLRLRNDRLERHRNGLSANWEPAMLEVLAGAAPPGVLRSRVDPRDVPHFLTFLLGYARRLRGEERATVRALARPYLPTLVSGMRVGSPEARGIAVETLAGLGMPDCADEIAGALNDRSPVVAMLAARGLYRQGQERHFPAVLEHLPRFKLWSRSFLASMLAGGGAGSAPLLRGILADTAQDPLVRAVAADALRSLNDLQAVEVVIGLLDTETDRELVVGCLRLIRQLGHRDHARLVRPFASMGDPVIRSAALSALGAIGGAADVPLLQHRLDDEAYWVSLQAARALMSLGEEEILRRLAASEGPWSLLAQQVLSE